MAIILLVGIPGSGKTTKAVELMETSLRRGRKVFTDIKLRPECPFVDRVYQIGTDEWPVAYEDEEHAYYQEKLGRRLPQFFWEYVPPGSDVFLDELDVKFDSADRGEAKRQMRLYVKYHEKRGHNVFGIVQIVTNLHKRWRSQAQRVIACENTRNTLKMWPYIKGTVELAGFDGEAVVQRLARFWYEEYPHESVVGKPNMITDVGYMTHREAAKYFKWFYTKQISDEVLRVLGGRWRDGHAVDVESGDVAGDQGSRRGRAKGSRRRASPPVEAGAVA